MSSCRRDCPFAAGDVCLTVKAAKNDSGGRLSILLILKGHGPRSSSKIEFVCNVRINVSLLRLRAKKLKLTTKISFYIYVAK